MWTAVGIQTYIIGERERANLVVQLARIYIYVAGVTHTVSVLNVST